MTVSAPMLDTIIAVTAWSYGLGPAELRGRSLVRTVSWPRLVAAYLCRRLGRAPYPAIGRALGGRHHTTIMAAERRVAAEVGSLTGAGSHVGSVDRAVRAALDANFPVLIP